MKVFMIHIVKDIGEFALYNNINVLTIKVSTSRHCLAYCYAGLLRDSLSEFVTLIKSERIREPDAQVVYLIFSTAHQK